MYVCGSACLALSPYLPWSQPRGQLMRPLPAMASLERCISTLPINTAFMFLYNLFHPTVCSVSLTHMICLLHYYNFFFHWSNLYLWLNVWLKRIYIPNIVWNPVDILVYVFYSIVNLNNYIWNLCSIDLYSELRNVIIKYLSTWASLKANWYKLPRSNFLNRKTFSNAIKTNIKDMLFMSAVSIGTMLQHCLHHFENSLPTPINGHFF